MIEKLYKLGLPVKRINAILSLPINEIKQFITTNNITIPNRTFNDNEREYVINAYKTGVSIKTLGRIYKIDKRRIERLLRQNNIDIRAKNDTHRFIDFDQHAFDKIETKEQAYWLGFLYADGSNKKSGMSLGLKASDYLHIEKFCDFIKIPKAQIKALHKKHPSVYVCANSQYFCAKLTELGCCQNKTFILKFPDFLPQHLISHFVRGYSDGDGSLKMNVKTKEWRWSAASTGEFLDSLQAHLKTLNINSYKTCISKTNNNTYALTISGNMQLKRFCDWLYQDSTLKMRLDRKYERYLKLTEQQRLKDARKIKT
jgi:intein-encoded DNA endonuclease-like protein